MKIRTDFVTNSSSSSFILGFKSEKDIEQTLQAEFDRSFYFDDDRLDADNEDFLDTVLRDCKEAEKKTLDEMAAELKKDLYWEAYRIVEKELEFQRIPWRERYNLMQTNEYQRKIETKLNDMINSIKKRCKENGNLVFVQLEYGDESGCFFSALEHEIVPMLSCCIKRISHH